MITNTGKNILAKYLVGQSPAYASYIAVGCGAKPLESDATLGDYSNKTNLDFEMFRVPIISRGYIDEDNVSKIVFTAELPTEERYEISEVAVYSAGENADAGPYDSRTLYSFSTNENWEYHSSLTSSQLESFLEPLDDDDDDNIINTINKAFITNADNRIFTNENRVARYERCRFLNSIVALSGNISDLSVGEDGLIDINGGDHIHLNGIALDFDKQSPIDQLRFAFSIINRDGQNTSSLPSQVMLMFEFDSVDQNGVGESAQAHIIIDHTPGHAKYDFSTNRYFVETRQLQGLIKTSGFSWSQVNVVKIYATVLDVNENPTDQFLVCLDAVRLENIATTNPLYGMTGYSIIRNTNAETIIKTANTTNYIEFRFAMDVQ